MLIYTRVGYACNVHTPINGQNWHFPVNFIMLRKKSCICSERYATETILYLLELYCSRKMSSYSLKWPKLRQIVMLFILSIQYIDCPVCAFEINYTRMIRLLFAHFDDDRYKIRTRVNVLLHRMRKMKWMDNSKLDELTVSNFMFDLIRLSLSGVRSIMMSMCLSNA